MENDSIRASGSNTVVDIWIDGKIRAICVSQEAIRAFVGLDVMTAMSDQERCDFVRDNLATVVEAAKIRLREGNAAADPVVIEAGQLPRSDAPAGEQRQQDRRQGE